MSYKIILTYRDDKAVNLVLPEEQVQDFFDNLNSGKVHLNKENDIGFWTTVDQLRHIIVQPFNPEDADVPKREDRQCNQPVPSGDEVCEAGEEPPRPEGE